MPATATKVPRVVIRARSSGSRAPVENAQASSPPRQAMRPPGPEPKMRDLMSVELLVCQRSDSCQEAAARMREGNVGMLPVMEGGRPVGVVTDRDLVVRHLAPGSDRMPHHSVAMCMTPWVVSVAPETTVSEATRLMRNRGVRRLLVLENGVLQGIVTLDDITLEVGRLASAALVIQQSLTDYHEGREAPRSGRRAPEGPKVAAASAA